MNPPLNSPTTAVRSAAPAAEGSAALPLPSLLGRGLLAGGLAGLVTGLFARLLADPLMDRAILAEEKRAAAEEAGTGHAHAAEEELFSRGMQHFGLVVTAVVVGLALGVFFALVHAAVHRREWAHGEVPHSWQRALLLAGAGFLACSLLPGLRYPANPPGVGDAGTVTERQTLWLAALAIGVLGTALAWQLHVRLGRAGHGLPARQLAAVGAVVLTLGALFWLPSNPDAVPVSPTVLWNFRVLSLADHLVLWAVLGGVFGALGLRAARRAAPQTTTRG